MGSWTDGGRAVARASRWVGGAGGLANGGGRAGRVACIRGGGGGGGVWGRACARERGRAAAQAGGQVLLVLIVVVVMAGGGGDRLTPKPPLFAVALTPPSAIADLAAQLDALAISDTNST